MLAQNRLKCLIGATEKRCVCVCVLRTYMAYTLTEHKILYFVMNSRRILYFAELLYVTMWVAMMVKGMKFDYTHFQCAHLGGMSDHHAICVQIATDMCGTFLSTV